MTRPIRQKTPFRTLLLVCLHLACLLGACTNLQAPSVTPRISVGTTRDPQSPTLTPFQPLPNEPAALATLEALSGDWPSEPYHTATIPAGALSSWLFPTNPPPAAPVGEQDATAIPTTAPELLLWADPLLPEAFRHQVTLPHGVTLTAERHTAALYLEVGAEHPLSRWVYALTAPFATVTDEVTFEQLLNTWRGQPEGPFRGSALLINESTLAVFSALWGAPATGATQTVQAGDLLSLAWNQRPGLAILPFEALTPGWKVIKVSGISPLQDNFDPSSYPLSAPISLRGRPELIEATLNKGALAPSGNRDPNKLTVLAMTGVTALVRATAFAMEQKGIHYPGRDIGDWLRSADLTHISNEVPFAEDCPYPNPLQQGMRFCSDPRYIGLLESVGADIIELTGDHFQDWGAAATLYTLELYKEKGWLYYGGGADLEEARRALPLEHNGNRLAFIGCNAKGGSFAQASAGKPGAAPCDFAWLEKEVTRLRAAGYLPIVTFQHFEYYTYQAQPNQQSDSRRLAKAGAVIVSGSQAHQPQGFEFTESGVLIHYGLGNLFFDQYDVSQATRQGFIDRHIFYDGRHISTELLTIVFVDYARARPMTKDERKGLLEAVFAASGW